MATRVDSSLACMKSMPSVSTQKFLLGRSPPFEPPPPPLSRIGPCALRRDCEHVFSYTSNVGSKDPEEGTSVTSSNAIETRTNESPRAVHIVLSPSAALPRRPPDWQLQAPCPCNNPSNQPSRRPSAPCCAACRLNLHLLSPWRRGCKPCKGAAKQSSRA